MKYKTFVAVLLLALLAAGLPGLNVQPAGAQGGAWWVAEYFNSGYLLGDVAARAQYGALNFNWGAGAPAANVNPDNFSARFATDVSLAAGTYRFYILADDGVTLRVGYPFQPQIDTFNQPQPGVVLSADVTVTGGVTHIQVDYRENTGDAYLYVDWQNAATATGPNFPTPVTTTGAWAAQYFTNPNLAGSPTVTLTETSPTHNWGEGSPANGIPADNFSVRWSRVQQLDAGTYQISVHADDGVRVFFDGGLIINEWHPASGQTYNGVFNAIAGQHSIVVEFYEGTGTAALEYNITRTDGGTISPDPGVGVGTGQTTVTGGVVGGVAGVTATVIASRLNVRNLPTAINSTVLTRISRGETYPVLGRNANSTWWLLNVNGTQGWVNGRYISINNEQNVPVVGDQVQTIQPPPVNTGVTVTPPLYNLNIRSGPGTTFDRVGRLPVGQSAAVIGRVANNSWWQINYNGVIGWVSGALVNLSAGADINQIPVTA